jgi:hypothetical protein
VPDGFLVDAKPNGHRKLARVCLGGEPGTKTKSWGFVRTLAPFGDVENAVASMDERYYC